MVAENMRQHSRRQRSAAPQATDWVEEFPFASVAVMFGIGVGVGLVVGHTIAEAAGRLIGCCTRTRGRLWPQRPLHNRIERDLGQGTFPLQAHGSAEAVCKHRAITF